MQGLKQSGAFTIPERTLAAIRAEFSAGRSSMEETAATIAGTLADCDYLADLSTAHPAKFPDAVEAAAGMRPNLPSWLAGLMEREEKYTVLPSDEKMVEDHISSRARTAA